MLQKITHYLCLGLRAPAVKDCKIHFISICPISVICVASTFYVAPLVQNPKYIWMSLGVYY